MDGTTLVIGGATVIKADQRAKNGMLHSIDAVIEPEGFDLIVSDTTTVLDVARDAGSFSTLLGALDTANLSETLAGEGPFTLLAPTDEAFAKLPEGALDTVLADPAALEQLVTEHVTGGVQLSSALADRSEIATITGQILPIVAEGTSVTIGGSLITTADIEADNGIVHVVDSVIFPEGLALGSDETAIDVLETTDEFPRFLMRSRPPARLTRYEVPDRTPSSPRRTTHSPHSRSRFKRSSLMIQNCWNPCWPRISPTEPSTRQPSPQATRFR